MPKKKIESLWVWLKWLKSVNKNKIWPPVRYPLIHLLKTTTIKISVYNILLRNDKTTFNLSESVKRLKILLRSKVRTQNLNKINWKWIIKFHFSNNLKFVALREKFVRISVKVLLKMSLCPLLRARPLLLSIWLSLYNKEIFCRMKTT